MRIFVPKFPTPCCLLPVACCLLPVPRSAVPCCLFPLLYKAIAVLNGVMGGS
ncbi:MAG: hypothetical protein F6J98_31135 [Moorea sp. SIO4G2]|nr:hypothetical protein [Moorena sp. SIO4G2]